MPPDVTHKTSLFGTLLGRGQIWRAQAAGEADTAAKPAERQRSWQGHCKPLHCIPAEAYSDLEIGW